MLNSHSKMSPFFQEVIAILRAKSGHLGMKNEVLARKSGLSQSQLSKIFHENQIPTLDQLDALCWHLGMKLHEVIRDAAERYPARFEEQSYYDERAFHVREINQAGI